MRDLTTIRAVLYADPALLTAALALVAVGARRLRHVNPAGTLPAWVARAVIVGAAACGIAYVCILAWYLSVPAYADHIESSVAAISWYVSAGHRFYPDSQDVGQYALPYGPGLFFVTSIPLRVFGPGIAASKIAGALGAVGSIALIAWTLRRHTSMIVTAGTVCLWYLAFGPMSFWARAEPTLLATVAVALAVLGSRGAIAAAGAGFGLGLAIELKITAAAYFLPVMTLLYQRFGARYLVGALGVAVVVAIAPFVLLPGASAGDYLAVLASTARHGLRWRGLSTQIQWALVLLVASGAFPRRAPLSGPQHVPRLFDISLAVGLILIVPIASKHGAGPYHFLPFVPTVVFLASRRRQSEHGPWLVSTWLLCAVALIALFQQAYWIGAVRSRPSIGVAEEVSRLTRDSVRPVAVGYASDYQVSGLRVIPVFAGQPYLLDAPALMDRQMSGEMFPAGAMRMVKSCAVATWLIPAGADPFALGNAYDGSRSVFPQEFIREFHRSYVRTQRHRYFDVWSCRGAG